MRKNFSVTKTPAGFARVALYILLGANLIAAYFLLRPLGGSPQELEAQAADLQAQVAQKSALLKLSRANVRKVELGRTEGDRFMQNYFLSERTASSTLIDELSRAAKEAKITPKEHSVQTEDIEGSDTLKMMTINGNYEGTYADLLQFVNRVDRSNRLLIIESLNATPQQAKGMLNVNLKMDTFVREDVAAQ
jgi:Tfp pilus assembly protein PilO